MELMGRLQRLQVREWLRNRPGRAATSWSAYGCQQGLFYGQLPFPPGLSSSHRPLWYPDIAAPVDLARSDADMITCPGLANLSSLGPGQKQPICLGHTHPLGCQDLCAGTGVGSLARRRNFWNLGRVTSRSFWKKGGAIVKCWQCPLFCVCMGGTIRVTGRSETFAN